MRKGMMKSKSLYRVGLFLIIHIMRLYRRAEYYEGSFSAEDGAAMPTERFGVGFEFKVREEEF